MKIKKIIPAFLAAAIAVSALPGELPAKAEILTGTAGWNFGTNGGAQIEYSLDSNVKFDGESSLKVACKTPAANNVFVHFNTSIPVKKGKSYQYGFMAKLESADRVQCCIDWGTRTTLTQMGSDSNWSSYEINYKHEKDTDSVTLRFLLDGITKGLWVDDVFCYEVDENGNKIGENLIKNGTFERFAPRVPGKKFSEKDLWTNIAGVGHMPMQYISEDTSGGGYDWKDIEGFSMPSENIEYTVFQKDSTPDIKADVKTAYNEDEICFHVDVKDRDHVFYGLNEADNEISAGENTIEQWHFQQGESAQEKKRSPWEGDCIQIALADNDGNNRREITVAHDSDKNEGILDTSSFDDEEKAQIKTITKRDGSTTSYEVSIPWCLMYKEIPESMLFDIAVADTDVEGDGRKGGVELTPGILQNKKIDDYTVLSPSLRDNSFSMWIGKKPQQLEKFLAGEEEMIPVYIMNYGDDEDFTVTVSGDTEERQFKMNVPKGQGDYKEYRFKVSGLGYKNIVITASNSTGSQMQTHRISVINMEQAYETAKEYYDKLTPLMEKCNQQGISTDYETVNYSVIEKFMNSLLEDRNNTDYLNVTASKHLPYVMDCLQKLYDETQSSLNAYLSGEKKPLETPHYVTSDIKIDGQSLIADTVTDGETERRPVFFIGYGHFERTRKDVPVFQNFGANTIQTEVVTKRVFTRPTDENPAVEGKDYAIDQTHLSEIKEALENAEKNNIAVNVLLGVHYFVDFYKDKYPEMYAKNFNMECNVWHPKAKQIYEDFIRYTMSNIKDYKSLKTICLTNESNFNTLKFRDFYTPYWHQYLEKFYNGDINTLNSNYDTSYTSFEEVELPEHPTDKTAKGYDWALFNGEVLKSWHQWMADIIHEYMPNLPINNKNMHYAETAWFQSNDTLYGGMDFEMASTFSEINGCDANKNYTSTNGVAKIISWYDYLTSIKDAPIDNSEDHMLPDGSLDFSENNAKYTGLDLWEGAIHGRGLSQIWVWDYKYSTNHYLGHSPGIRPDLIAEAGKTSLDLNRLAYEITALQNGPREVLHLYSRESSLYYDSRNPWARRGLYDSTLYNGLRTEYATESQIDKIDASKYKLLMIPRLHHVKEATLRKIKQFVDDGGKVVIYGTDSLRYNEYNKPHDEALVKSIYDKAYIINMGSTWDDTKIVDTPYETVTKAIRDCGLSRVRIMDAETGKQAKKVGYEMTEYNGKLLMSVFNNTLETKTVYLETDAGKLTNLKERRSESTLDDVFTLEPYQAVLIETDANIDLPSQNGDSKGAFSDIKGHWAESAINELAEKGIVNGVGESAFEPDGGITNAQFLAMVSRAAGLAEKQYRGGLNDVSVNDWFAPAVQSALDNGLLDHMIVDGGFKPNMPITRENMAYLAVKAYEIKKGAKADTSDLSFTDKERISDDKKEYVGKSLVLNMISGYPDGSFMPLNGATRAEAAAIVSVLTEK